MQAANHDRTSKCEKDFRFIHHHQNWIQIQHFLVLVAQYSLLISGPFQFDFLLFFPNTHILVGF